MNTLAMKRQKTALIFLFLLIPVLLLITFSYYPAFRLVQLSFTSWDGISRDLHYIGFSNYVETFKRPENLSAFRNNLIYLVVGFLQIIIALYFAVVLNGKVRGGKAFRAIFFVPYVLNSIAIAFMFQYVLASDFGALNTALRGISLDFLAMKWLTDPQLVNFTFGFMGIWKYMGFMMIIFLGALKSIPEDLYEAADIDGANAFQRFFSITMPNIRRIIELSLFLNLNGALGAFEFPFALYPLGSPFGMADTFVVRTLQSAFKYSNFGLASAMGVILMLIVMVLVLIQHKLVAGKEE